MQRCFRQRAELGNRLLRQIEWRSFSSWVHAKSHSSSTLGRLYLEHWGSEQEGAAVLSCTHTRCWSWALCSVSQALTGCAASEGGTSDRKGWQTLGYVHRAIYAQTLSSQQKQPPHLASWACPPHLSLPPSTPMLFFPSFLACITQSFLMPGMPSHNLPCSSQQRRFLNPWAHRAGRCQSPTIPAHSRPLQAFFCRARTGYIGKVLCSDCYSQGMFHLCVSSGVFYSPTELKNGSTNSKVLLTALFLLLSRQSFW